MKSYRCSNLLTLILFSYITVCFLFNPVDYIQIYYFDSETIMRLAHAPIKARPCDAVGPQRFLSPSNDGDSNSSGIYSIKAKNVEATCSSAR
jgi:hypothetical protein